MFDRNFLKNVNIALHLTCLFLLIIICLPSKKAHAQTVIRDAEIEQSMRNWFAPIFEAAHIDQDIVDIVIVQDAQINAFVAGGANIFFYTGLLQKTDDPGEIIGIMAHELGHISGSHLTRSQEALRNASRESLLGILLGIGAAAVTGEGGAAAAIGTGTRSVAERRFLATSRAYEASADQAALKTMHDAKMSTKGFLTFLQKLESEELLPASQQSEYVRTHPLTSNRIERVARQVEESPYKNKKFPEDWVEQHARMNAKLIAFISPEQVPWIYDDRDTGIPAQYARAIAAYRQNKSEDALSLIDKLILQEPQNPFFYELKGQVLFEFGRLQESLTPYEKAIALDPNASLIRTALAHAQIETGGDNAKKLGEAIQNLQRALKDEARSPRIHRLLATAYGRLGNDPVARLHLAEEALLQRKIDYARRHAEAAQKGLKEGTAEWLRVKDILLFIRNHEEKSQKKRKR